MQNNAIMLIRKAAAVLICAAIFLLPGCDEAAGPETLELTIEAEVTAMRANRTCEGNGNEGKADVYSQLRMYKLDIWGATEELLYESDWILVQLGLHDEVAFPGIEGTMDVDIVDLNRVVVRIETYENDPAGPSTRKFFYFNLGYMADTRCWTDKVTGDCHPDSEPGSSLFSVPMQDDLSNLSDIPPSSDPSCHVVFDWRVEATFR